MPNSTISLQQISIAAPCNARWDRMSGDDRVRHCAQCDLNVYNLSAMTEDAVRDLIEHTEGRLCGRLFQRADGTYLFNSNCPVGLRLLRKRVAEVLGRVAAGLMLVVGLFTFARAQGAGDTLDELRAKRDRQPLATLRHWIDPPDPPVVMGRMIMGDIALPQMPPPAQGGMAGGGS